MRRYLWLVDLQVAGQSYRWSTEDVSVLTAAGVELVYRAGLDEGMSLAQGDIEVDIKVLDPSVDWPTIGPLLDGARVVVRRWREGDALERAEVYARGTATEPEWGSVYDEASWTSRPVETLPPMPDPLAQVSEITTEEIDGDARIPPGQAGRYYPVIFGFPGRYIRQYSGASGALSSGLLETAEQVVPCPMRVLRLGALTAADSQIVVSHDATRFLPLTVRLREEETGMEAVENVIATTDALGRRIAVADLTSDFQLFALPDDGPEYSCSIGPADGGLPAPRSAYDVIVSVLEQWGGDTVDWARIPEIRDHLSGYLVDTWIDVECPGGVWAWLVSALGVADAESTSAAGLPVAIRTSAEGRYFVPLRYTVDQARTIRTVDVSRGEASRVSSLRTKGTPSNFLEISYGYDLSAFAGEVGGNIPAMITHTATIGTSTLTACAPSAVASASAARYGLRALKVDVSWTWDHATALRVGLGLLDRDALPWRHILYRVPEEWALRESDQIRLIDGEMGLDELAIVNGPPLVGPDGMDVSLRMPGVF